MSTNSQDNNEKSNSLAEKEKLELKLLQSQITNQELDIKEKSRNWWRKNFPTLLSPIIVGLSIVLSIIFTYKSDKATTQQNKISADQSRLQADRLVFETEKKEWTMHKLDESIKQKRSSFDTLNLKVTQLQKEKELISDSLFFAKKELTKNNELFRARDLINTLAHIDNYPHFNSGNQKEIYGKLLTDIKATKKEDLYFTVNRYLDDNSKRLNAKLSIITATYSVTQDTFWIAKFFYQVNNDFENLYCDSKGLFKHCIPAITHITWDKDVYHGFVQLYCAKALQLSCQPQQSYLDFLTMVNTTRKDSLLNVELDYNSYINFLELYTSYASLSIQNRSFYPDMIKMANLNLIHKNILVGLFLKYVWERDPSLKGIYGINFKGIFEVDLATLKTEEYWNNWQLAHKDLLLHISESRLHTYRKDKKIFVNDIIQ